jgi:Co/Zn/Cd efflux system component
LSAVLLLGLVLNLTVGWFWADPIAGLVIAAVAIREGVQAWRGDGCCTPAKQTAPAEAQAAPAGVEGCCDDACCSD